MDAFYCSVEELDNPSLKGRPVVVGGTPEGRGVVATANYAAREFGVHSAMPAARAIRLCPRAEFLRPRPKRYSEVSREVFSIFGKYTPLVEPLSIDEAFLDVTGSRLPGVPANVDEEGYGAGVAIARALRERVEKETGGLTCSIGIASNKYLAKIASDLRKPRGMVIVPLGAEEEFLGPLPIEKIWGVGPKMAGRLRAIGLDLVGDMQRLGVEPLQRALGDETGEHFWRLCRGVDHRPVVTEQEVKSISQEKTYGQFLAPSDRETIERELFRMSDKVAARLRARELWGRTVQLKARDEKFHTVTRSASLDSPTCLVEEIYRAVLGMFDERVDFDLLGDLPCPVLTSPALALRAGTGCWSPQSRLVPRIGARRRCGAPASRSRFTASCGRTSAGTSWAIPGSIRPHRLQNPMHWECHPGCGCGPVGR